MGQRPYRGTRRRLLRLPVRIVQLLLRIEKLLHLIKYFDWRRINCTVSSFIYSELMNAKNNNSNSTACQHQIKLQRPDEKEAGVRAGVDSPRPREGPGSRLGGAQRVWCCRGWSPRAPGLLAAPALPDLPCKDSSWAGTANPMIPELPSKR